jgi:heat shock protein HslJ
LTDCIPVAKTAGYRGGAARAVPSPGDCSMSIRHRLTLALAALALLLSGCAGMGARMESSSWRLVEWGATTQSLPATAITARFADGQVTGRSAVNTYSGRATLGPGVTMAIGPLATTRMAGPQPAMHAESTYLALLSGSKKFQVLDGRLTLRDGNDDVTLVFVASAD